MDNQPEKADVDVPTGAGGWGRGTGQPQLRGFTFGVTEPPGNRWCGSCTTLRTHSIPLSRSRGRGLFLVMSLWLQS